MRHIYGGIGLFAIFVFALPFMQNAGAAGFCDQPYSGEGDWVINGVQNCENVKYTIQGNVLIKTGAQVNWKNVVLNMFVGNGAEYIKAEKDARVVLDRVRVKASKPDERYYISIENPQVARISNSEFSEIGFRDWSETEPGKGLEIFTSGLNSQAIEITGNYIHDGANGLYLTSNPSPMKGVYAANNRVENVIYNGVYLNQVYDSIFEGNYFNGIQEHRGIMCVGCGNNTFNENEYYRAPNGGGMLFTRNPNSDALPNRITNSYFGQGLLHGIGFSNTDGEVVENNVFENNIIGDARAGVIAFLPDSKNTVVRYNTIRNSRIGIEYFSPPNIQTVEFNNIYNNTWNAKINYGDNDKIMQNNYWGTTNCGAIDSRIWDNDESQGSGKALYEPFLNAEYPGGASIQCDGSLRADEPLYPWSSQTLLYTDALNDASENVYDIKEYYAADTPAQIFFRTTFDSIAGGEGIVACGGKNHKNYRASFLINNWKNQCVFFDLPEQYIQVDGTGEALFYTITQVDDANFLFGQKPYSVNRSIQVQVAINCLTQSIDVGVFKKDLVNYNKEGIRTKTYTTNTTQTGPEEIRDMAADQGWLKYPKK